MLTKAETASYKALISGEVQNVALLEGSFRGERAAFLVSIFRDGEMYDVYPFAVFLRKSDLDHCVDPNGKPLE